MKPVSDLFSRVMPYLPGGTEPLVAQALVDAAIMFCEDAQVVRTTLDTITCKPGQAAYDLLAPNQQIVGRIQRV